MKIKKFDMYITGSEEELDKVEYNICGYSYCTGYEYIWVYNLSRSRVMSIFSRIYNLDVKIEIMEHKD
jgi:hypothetical protein